LIVGTWPSEKLLLFLTLRVNEAIAIAQAMASLERTSYIQFTAQGRACRVGFLCVSGCGF
jgi:hypothetical protein